MATEQPKMDSEERPVHSRCNKQIEVRACGKLYSELAWSDPIMYFRAPQESGILFKVDYYDSVDMLGSHAKSAPTVCILHGAPGNYEEFSSLINSLTIRGLRVVAPNFPDYNATYQLSFRHSARERLDFLLELFKAIDVTQIDMLIGHSSAVYTMFELLDHSLSADRTKWPTTSDDFHIQIKSLGLFSTPSHRLPKNLERTTLKMISLKLWDYAWLKPLLLAGTGWIVKLLGIKNRVEYDKIENLLIASSAMGLSDYPKMGQRLSLLKEQRIPVLFVYGTKDRLIPVDKFEELERDLGVDDQSCVKQFRSDGSLVRDRTASEKLVQVSRFEEGGHYVFRKYSKQVNDDVCEFLRHKVQRNDKSDNSQL